MLSTQDGPSQWSEVPYLRRPTWSERIVAAVAHLLTLLSIPGILLASVIWFTQRRRSRYIAMQARQAVLWQTLGHIIVFVAIVLLLVTAVFALGDSNASGLVGQIAGGSAVGSVIGLFLIPVGVTVFFFVSSLIGTIAALLGKRYTYPWVGRMAHRSVSPAADLRSLPHPPTLQQQQQPRKQRKK